ncbi:MAG: MATE family efflux transporter [Aeromicrobium sp.]
MRSAHDREILRLAWPAFLALVAEPLFLLSDAAIVGHLGTPELAGLGIAAVILQTIVGLCVFLAYGTTASVARQLGAGNTARALAQGIDGVWLALVIGVIATGAGLLLLNPAIAAFGASDAVNGFAADYLRIALLGITPLLVMLATTGILRGLQDTKTPLIVAVGGNVLNLLLNVVLVFGVGSFQGLGIAGSALGSVIAQVVSAGALLWVVVRAARAEGAALTPDLPGIRAAGRAGLPLVIRTVTLRAAILVTTYAVVAGAAGTANQTVDVATHQLAMTLWGFLAFVLYAIAIAAQAITGRHLGAGDLGAARAVTRRMIQWGAVSGVATGLLLAASSPVLGVLFTNDANVQDRLVPVLLVAAIGQPLAGVVFVLDGVLIGAGDGRYLAWAGIVVLLVYAPAALLASSIGGLVLVWIAFAGIFMAARGVVLMVRAQGDQWMVTGVSASPRR